MLSFWSSSTTSSENNDNHNNSNNHNNNGQSAPAGAEPGGVRPPSPPATGLFAGLEALLPDSFLPDASSFLPAFLHVDPNQKAALNKVQQMFTIEGSPHIFYKKTFGRPTFCNYCQEFIWGIAAAGYCCEICEYAVHNACMNPNIPRTCQLTNVSWIFSGGKAPLEEASVEEKITALRVSLKLDLLQGFEKLRESMLYHPFSFVFDIHHWVSGNVGFKSKCFRCQKQTNVYSVKSFRCSRCRVTVHGSCLQTLAGEEGWMLCTPAHAVFRYHPARHGPILHDHECNSNNNNNNNNSNNLVEEKNNNSEKNNPEHNNLDNIIKSKKIIPPLANASDEFVPLIVFVNGKSGGQQGPLLLRKFRRILSPSQVFDLAAGGPNFGLKRFSSVEKLRILACGGDGTVSWVLQTCDLLNITAPVGILPLGTGNDLSRTLGFGPGYDGEAVLPLLCKLVRCPVIPLDRWKVNFHPKNNPIEQQPFFKLMNNYFSIGVDAKIAHDFHTFGNEKPELFSWRLGNKLWYALGGVKAMFESDPPLATILNLYVNGEEVKLPAEMEGMIILNLPYYAGGTCLWAPFDPNTPALPLPADPNNPSPFVEQSIQDGFIEIVCVRSSFHMGTITTNLGSAVRIAQGAKVEIVFKDSHKNPVPMQVDGEPWLQPAATIITFTLENRRPMLCLSHMSTPHFVSPEDAAPEPAFSIEKFLEDFPEDDSDEASESALSAEDLGHEHDDDSEE